MLIYVNLKHCIQAIGKRGMQWSLVIHSTYLKLLETLQSVLPATPNKPTKIIHNQTLEATAPKNTQTHPSSSSKLSFRFNNKTSEQTHKKNIWVIEERTRGERPSLPAKVQFPRVLNKVQVDKKSWVELKLHRHKTLRLGHIYIYIHIYTHGWD